MKFRRTVAGILAVINIFNTTVAFAHEHGQHHAQEDRLQKHTVTITAEPMKGNLISLSSSPTDLEDHGSVLTNADGVASVEIQGTYHRNQTLAAVSMEGTSFSFAPIMSSQYLSVADGDTDPF